MNGRESKRYKDRDKRKDSLKHRHRGVQYKDNDVKDRDLISSRVDLMHSMEKRRIKVMFFLIQVVAVDVLSEQRPCVCLCMYVKLLSHSSILDQSISILNLFRKLLSFTFI